MRFSTLNRRDCLRASAGATLAAAISPLAYAKASAAKRVLFFTKSSGFQHSVVRRGGNGELAHAETTLIDIGKQHGFDVTASKDGRVFDTELDRYQAVVFYTTGDLTRAGTDGTPPMTEKGKQALLEAIRGGLGFAGSHCASDSFHSRGERFQYQRPDERDPYIAMLGGEFIRHGRQQKATMTVVDGDFPGMSAAGKDFAMHEEWYSLKNFAEDMHVLLVNETEGMQGKDYQRPPFPATWARQHGQGRVFYTSMGHREDVWTNPVFQSIFAGGIHWILGEKHAQIPANLGEATPKAQVMPPK